MAGSYDKKIPLIVIAGPTACGKSRVAALVAERIGGEVVCADSMQIYDRLEVGTAPPTAEELSAAPHHLYGFLPPEQPYSVAAYVKDATAVIEDISRRGKRAVICGGTGLYISSLISGIEFADSRTDHELRCELWRTAETEGVGSLISELRLADSEFADSLDQSNVKRVVRAVEVLRTTGLTIPQQNIRSLQAAPRFEADYFVLFAADRERMYKHIEERIDRMLDAGLLAEARLVFDNRHDFKTAAQAIGYKELFPYFEGEKSLEMCIQELKTATRHYAKRQLTWFRREKAAQWIDTGTSDIVHIVDVILKKQTEE